MLSLLPAALIMIAGAFVLPFVGRRIRPVLLLGIPLLTLAQIWSYEPGTTIVIDFLDYQLTPVKVDALGRLFATIFAIMAAAGGLYAMNQKRIIELIAAYIYAGSAIGVALAGDLITVFVYWEMMAVASTLVIWSADTNAAYRASMRYVLVHLLGGVILMVGIVWQVADTGSVAFTAMQADSPARWLILIGFLLNAGAPPLSAWLPDAYPEASFSGTVFLSAFTTKTAVYVLIRGFPGEEILIFIGLYMIFYGIIYALLENDMRRILAYSIVNQVGFMITGIGIGTDMALNGASAHAFTHIIYKALLLMSAGSVLYMTGKRKCTDLGGLFRTMPLTMVCGTIGALAISSFPLTSGFISKSMISQAAADEQLMLVWMFLAAASAGVFLHAGIKFPWFVFFQKDSGMRPPDPPGNMRLAMVIMAVLCVGLGVFPGSLYAILPYPVGYVPYTADHVLKMLQLLLFSGLAFFLLLPMMKRSLTITLDVDWFYRHAGDKIARSLAKLVSAFIKSFDDMISLRLKMFSRLNLMLNGSESVLTRSQHTGSMVMWVIVVLCGYLAFYLFG
ncbi:MAG: Na(+)/H(+) antiporter subunit D [Rhodospirillaceae bacterium]|jgi:multicomponent Na+:H+ antiporter subunit D|nr:Na(+)/H(+) antiporter subunit D [Rhodospirillaceae bacterium]MBT5244353.1 Na(+)/H(+) antiporter subunit D [Rhodospirillaceae bacterium]MBT5563714.1 Na(+)/H(+) antiporter subunit D [Rhodospirillaceae bacterium]MBT6241544.1 Na(+)/H(+) antiporter subunit D [Rhodospirillaceae bacterium]MBT7137040.1 Na(+)/H(+) antiporter subunit D [Rhodospirillaceae bacterium]